MDIPFVLAVKQAENSDPYAAPSAKIAVNKNLMKMMDFLQENVTNNAELLKELSNPAGTPLSPKMQRVADKYSKEFPNSSTPIGGTVESPERIKVIDPDGKPGTVDAGHLQELLAAGGKRR